MQQTVTDKIFNHRYLALTGAFFLLLIIVINFVKADSISIETNANNEIVCEIQANVEVSVLIIEETNEEDIKVGLCFFSFGLNRPVHSLLHNLTTLSTISFSVTPINNYFQSDLSPPLFM